MNKEFQYIKERVQTIDKKTYLIIFGVLLVTGIIAWNVFSAGRCVSNNSDGIGQVRSDIRSAQQQQSAAYDGIGRVENGLGASAAEAGRISDGIGSTTESIAAVENRIDASESKLRSSADLIAEGKRIVSTVRERGKVGK